MRQIVLLADPTRARKAQFTTTAYSFTQVLLGLDGCVSVKLTVALHILSGPGGRTETDSGGDGMVRASRVA